MVEKAIDCSIPSYDLSIGENVLFNASDVGEDDTIFMISRVKLADAVADRRKINTVKKKKKKSWKCSHYAISA